MSLDVSIRFQSSRQFPESMSLGFDSYRVAAVPNSDGKEAVLEFKDEWIQSQTASNPVQEGKLILSWLSGLLRSRLAVRAEEINGMSVESRSAYPQFSATLEPTLELLNLFDTLCSFDEKLFCTYLRACDLYQLAAQVIDDRPSLANFLFVSCIECLGSVVTPGGSFRQSFLSFIKRYCPSGLLGTTIPQMPVDGLLSKIHEFRSQYAHGGKDVPTASLLADKQKLVWVKHFEDGKEELAPSIGWFESVVQASLIEFLRTYPKGTIPVRKRQRFIDLALGFGTTHLKAKRNIQAGQVLTGDDVELQ
jgi:hypothetical protein